MSNKKFWIVMSEMRGPASYPYRHETESAAFSESVRLAREHGGKFFVMECIGASARLDVVTHKFNRDGSDDEIPF